MPIISEEGGGGAGVLSNREVFSHAAESIAPGGAHQLSWGKLSGATLLTLTDPTLPVVVSTGVYAVSVQVTFDTPTAAAKSGRVGLFFDVADESYGVSASGSLGLTEGLELSLALTAGLTAGMIVAVEVTHDDLAALNCQLSAVLTQIG